MVGSISSSPLSLKHGFSEEAQAPELAAKPRPVPTREEWEAAYREKHPLLSPQEALASGAGLGEPTGTGRADNQTKNIHSEIKINGKVVARAYNKGSIEIATEYGFLGEEIDFASDTMNGPELAEDRMNRIKAVLERYGAVVPDEQDPVTSMLSAVVARQPVLELVKASTALTQDEWLGEKAKEGPLDPGTLFSRTV